MTRTADNRGGIPEEHRNLNQTITYALLAKVNRYSRTESILRRDHDKFSRFREIDVTHIVDAKAPDVSMDKHRQSSRVGNLSFSSFHFSCFVSYFFRLPDETEAI